MPKKIIAIVGGHTQNTTDGALLMAERIGFELAQRELAVVCGGGDGVMEAACRGCQEGGGVTLGILKGNHLEEANRFIEYAIPTSMDVASNNVIVWAASGVLAFDGRYGTLNEIALALDFGKPLIVIGEKCLLDVSAIRSRQFAHYKGYDPGRAAAIVDQLERMIEQVSYVDSL
jgi:uncharacterized protein (TIGR00725 family)